MNGLKLTPVFFFVFVISIQIDHSLQINTRNVKLHEVCDVSPEMQKNPIGFRDINNVRNVLKEFQEDRSKCPEMYHQSLLDLREFTDEQLLADVCSLDTYQKIRAYHEKYISIYTPDKLKDDLFHDMRESPLMPILPVARQFFVLFVQQISAICKKHLVARVDAEARSQLRDIEQELLEQIGSMEFKISMVSGRRRPKSIHNLVMSIPTPKSEHDDGSTLYVQVRYSSNLKILSDACNNIFKPIIDEVFRPVILLDNLGYWDTNLSYEENKQLNQKPFRRWYPVVEACEALKDIEVIQDSSSKAAATDLMAIYGSKGDKNEIHKINVLTEAESKELKAQIEANIEKYDDMGDLVNPRVQTDFSHKPQTFGHRMDADESDEWRSGMRQFEARTKSLIKEKTDWFLLKLAKIKSTVLKYFQSMRKHVKTRDDTTVMGRVTLFLDRHEHDISVGIIAAHLLLLLM